MIEFKKGSTTDLLGELIMESVGRSEKEFKLNNPVPAPHIIPICFYSIYFFPRVSNLSVEDTKEINKWNKKQIGII